MSIQPASCCPRDSMARGKKRGAHVIACLGRAANQLDANQSAANDRPQTFPLRFPGSPCSGLRLVSATVPSDATTAVPMADSEVTHFHPKATPPLRFVSPPIVSSSLVPLRSACHRVAITGARICCRFCNRFCCHFLQTGHFVSCAVSVVKSSFGATIQMCHG